MAELEDELDALLTQYDDKLQKQFRTSIADVQSGVVLKNVVQKLEAGDTQGAIEELHIDEDSYAGYYEILRDLLVAVGFAVFFRLPRLTTEDGKPSIYRWSPRNEANWFDPEVDGNIGGIVSSINYNVRETITTGQLLGRTAKQITYDIFGIWNTVNGVREGSVFGMSNTHMDVVNRTLAAFVNNDPAGMRNYLSFARRNPAYDEAVRAALASGKKLDSNTLLSVMVTLKEGYTQLRSESLAFTLAASILNRTVHSIYHAAASLARLSPDSINRIWGTMRDGDVRHTHAELEGKIKPGFEEPFLTSSGAQLRYPCDRALGAGLEEIAGCRCKMKYSFAASRTWNYGNVL